VKQVFIQARPFADSRNGGFRMYWQNYRFKKKTGNLQSPQYINHNVTSLSSVVMVEKFSWRNFSAISIN